MPEGTDWSEAAQSIVVRYACRSWRSDLESVLSLGGCVFAMERCFTYPQI